jgi:hypothetical protein
MTCILTTTCLICSEKITKKQGKIICSEDTCHYHKKCFKKNVNYENDIAINMGYNGTKYNKKSCDCGHKIKVFNDHNYYFRKYWGIIAVIPIIILI